jgi:uncharacterized protein HemX
MNTHTGPLQGPIVQLALDLAKLRTNVETALPHLATHADVRGCEVRVIKWMIGVAVALGLGFGTWLHGEFAEMHADARQTRQEMAQSMAQSRQESTQSRQELAQTRQDLQQQMAQMREQMNRIEQAVARLEERQQRK